MRVELDKKSLFALASDTRLDILKNLQPMRRTVTQLSESLSIDKAAVYRHLKKLEEGGFVRRYEDHGFVYYGLSWKARDLLSPNENTKIIVMLSSSWILTVIVAFLLLAALISSGVPGFQGLTGETGPTGYNATDMQNPARFNAGLDQLPWFVLLAAAIALAVIAAALVIFSTKALIKPKQPPLKPEEPIGERDLP